jgi:hypothetical protein
LSVDTASVNNEKVAARTPDSAKKRKSPLKEYLSVLAKRLPKIDGKGYFYFSEGTGRQSVQQRERLTGDSLKKGVLSVFPSGHIHKVSSPSIFSILLQVGAGSA